MSINLFKLAAESARDGVTIADAGHPDMPLIYVNPAFQTMTGYDYAESVDTNCRYLQGPETDPAKVKELRELISQQKEGLVTLLNYRKDGQPFWNELSIAPIRDHQGDVTHFVGIQKDVTERVDMARKITQDAEALKRSHDKLQSREQELARLNERMRLFVGYTAHDLRSPLGIISSLAKYGNNANCNAARRVDLLERIRETADSCLELVSTILQETALGTGELRVKQTSQPLGPLIHDALRSVANLADGQQIQTEVAFPQDLRLHIDGPRMVQLLINLLINAIKYSPQGATLYISAVAEGSRARLSIRNRVANTPSTLDTSDIYRSAGLGLQIVETILNAHGSALEVEEGDGFYTVQCLLPLA